MLLVTLFVTLLYHCKNPKLESDYFSPEILASHSNGENFVGSDSCIECHADIYADHQQTAHYNTSAIADSLSIKGDFGAGANILDLESVTFTMMAEGNSFYQHTEIKNRLLKKAPLRFDIAIGSGVRGQSYVTWQNDSLYQIQASYYTPTDSWVNSPGFPSYNIERPIRDACLKCHLTYAKNNNTSDLGNSFDKTQMIYGVDCERCHRPGEKHVLHHKNNPNDTVSKNMMRFGALSRQQRLDACAQCHSGLRDNILKGDSFSFLTGDVLDEHSRNFVEKKTDETLDVHGNQYGLLTRSKCFQETRNMDCITCHDPHKNQRTDTRFFNQKCMACHRSSAVVCSQDMAKRDEMENNCVACHMPTAPSQIMTVKLAEDSLETSFNIRTHLIAIYQEEAQEVRK